MDYEFIHIKKIKNNNEKTLERELKSMPYLTNKKFRSAFDKVTLNEHHTQLFHTFSIGFSFCLGCSFVTSGYCQTDFAHK